MFNLCGFFFMFYALTRMNIWYLDLFSGHGGVNQLGGVFVNGKYDLKA